MKTKIKNFINKKKKRKLICLTSYSKSITQILDKYCDLILVGDSLANVLYGMKNTHNLKLETMINHAKAVRLGAQKSLVVVDMPKGSYNNSSQALKNVKRVIKETGCDAIKIENNFQNLNIVKTLVKAKINVMGHIGFTPQFKTKFKVEGKNKIQQTKLIRQAQQIEKAGVFSIVLECISKITAQKITKSLKIPTIGIGSSNLCDGQILVTDDLLGISGFYPKFVKKYANLNKTVDEAVKKFNKEVKLNKFPQNKNSF